MQNQQLKSEAGWNILTWHFGHFWNATKLSAHPLEGAFAALLHKFATLWASCHYNKKYLNAKPVAKK